MNAALTYGDISERHDRAPLSAQIGDQPSVGSVNFRGLVRIVSAQLVDRRTAVPGTGPSPRRDGRRRSERGYREERYDEDSAGTGRKPGNRATDTRMRTAEHPAK